MSGYSAAAMLALKAVQVILALLHKELGLSAYRCPTSTSAKTAVENGPFDLAIVGGGTAGSVIAHRLSKTTNMKIIVIEEGTCAPIESFFPGLFPLLPLSDIDRQMNIYNDSRSCQHLKSGVITAGKVLGGSSNFDHMIYVPDFEPDFSSWLEATNDSSYSFSELLKYWLIGENVQDPATVTENTTLHGDSGPQIMTKQRSTPILSIMNGLVELGSTYKEDALEACTANFPLLNIGDDCNKVKQGGIASYLTDLIGNTNVTFVTGATVTKINFDGTTATGVQMNVSGEIYTVNASKVVLAAGAIKTPQLLMLSGIGNKSLLNDLNIDNVVDNAYVGQHLTDHPGVVVGYGLDYSTETASSADPNLWPTEMITNYYAPSCNGTVTTQNIILTFPPNSTGFLQLCRNCFKYEDEICDKLYMSNINRNFLFVIHNLGNPKSTGYILPTSNSIYDDPTVVLNILKEDDDLNQLAQDVMAFNEIVNTTALKALGPELADIGLCTNLTGNEFWKCYVLEMSSTMWHYSGTCGLGRVTDSNMTVMGTTNLKVGDASLFPTITTGNIMGNVRMVAEKCAATIGEEWFASQSSC